MAYEYGYGVLEDQLITMFREGAPDFIMAENFIAQGANLNATGKDPEENILSEILWGYREIYNSDEINEECDDCEDACDNYTQKYI